MRLLFVCTGNICRSPVAERLTLARASGALAGSPELGSVEVVSAGVQAVAGAPMDRHSARALESLGGDPGGFGSQRLTAELAESADLVLTMTRKHREAVLSLAPRGLRRTFTLAEAADLAALADLSGLNLSPMDGRAREFGLRLDAARARRQTSPADDIADPMGQRSAVHTEVAARIERALRPLADVLFTSVRSRLAVPLLA
ncbi:low molecular weight phosphatase family protein [Blastococcus sp. URHD0036]|uniref:arsenate reductase/protein-tyrosine-phosphatase family protein n=1 Tax=Blastococcus sp. URHD0036 TaxID=1380356 RepID=UPI00069068D3|nr:low molecular weight phosphatase family protein [Blastococcus sp. URHD0036]